MNRAGRRRLTAEQRRQLDQLEELDTAWLAYRKATAELSNIRQCSATWAPDVDGLTRCQLLDGHEGQHRHRPRGASAAVVTW